MQSRIRFAVDPRLPAEILARHEDDDGVIARVALGSAVSPTTKRVAAELLASSRRSGDVTR
jgi:hypothetical protein